MAQIIVGPFRLAATMAGPRAGSEPPEKGAERSMARGATLAPGMRRGGPLFDI